MKKDLPGLQIPEEILNRIVEHARQEYPLESCGILAGKTGEIAAFYPMTNTEKSSSCYLMEPEEQFRVFQDIEKKRLEISAIYHSHPHTAAFPSRRDVDCAFYPDSLILIVSLKDKKDPQIEAFQIGEGKIQEKTIKVTKD